MEQLHNLSRALVGPLGRALEAFSIVVVAGPRQFGKSTLVQDPAVGAGRLYLTLDDVALLDEARRAPDRLLERAAHVTVDEVQRAPELLLAMKRAVDRRRSPGRFLVTGSADVRSLRGVADRLPGRAIYLDLEPLTVAERVGDPASHALDGLLLSPSAEGAREALGSHDLRAETLPEMVRRGGFPEPSRLRDDAARDLWFDAYLRSWYEGGARDLVRIDDTPDLRRLLLALAARTGGLLNQAEAARDAALPRTTAHRYVNLASVGRLLDLLPAYARSRSVRVVKAPRVFWRDVGLGAHLGGLRAGADPREHPHWGAWLENLVLANLRGWASSRLPAPDILAWRTAAGREVDLVVELEGRAIPIEVKASRRPGRDDLSGLLAFLERHDRIAPYGVLLHAGETVETPAPRVVSAPIRLVL